MTQLPSVFPQSYAAITGKAHEFFKPMLKDDSMKIAIPATEQGILCPHFGHAPRFAIVETDEQTVQNTNLLTPDQGGHAAVPPWLQTLGVSCLIAGGLGAKAIENLNLHGIDVHYGAPELPVETIAEMWLKQTLHLDPHPCDHKPDHDCGHNHENA